MTEALPKRKCKPRGVKKNRVGKRYGRLLVLEFSRRLESGDALWKCRCDCGNVIDVRGGNLGKGSKSCGCLALEARRLPRLKARRDPIKNFWRRVDKTGSCWLWTGHKKQDGYGVFVTVELGYQTCHRWAWKITNGTIPEGMCVCHKCDNPACVNPDHLFLGTQLQNIQDRVSKNRTAKGEASWNAKLRESDVTEIRRLRASGERMTEIAKTFGVHNVTIAAICHRRTWKHVA